jgi:hypothetical protein
MESRLIELWIYTRRAKPVGGRPDARRAQRRLGWNNNEDLIAHCAELLENQPWIQMNVTRKANLLTIITVGLDQVDLYIDGHPGVQRFLSSGTGQNVCHCPPIPVKSKSSASHTAKFVSGGVCRCLRGAGSPLHGRAFAAAVVALRTLLPAPDRA